MSIQQNGHALPDLSARNGAYIRALPDTPDVLDFLTATRDEHAFRAIRDKFPSFNLADVPGVSGAAETLWILRCEHDAGAVQNGRPLDSVVADGLRALSDLDPDASDALAWLEDENATVYKLSEAPRVARRLVEQWQQTPRFNFLSLSSLKQRPAPSFLIHGLLVCGGTSLLTAKHASFKSFFALDMALCIACDLPFHGLEVRPGRVVYVAAEGAAGLTKRALAWELHHGAQAGENFIVLDTPVQIAEPKTREAFIEAVADLRPALIVFDTLARCAVGLDENSSRDMGQFADALGAVAKATGSHVLTVHHNNKGGDYRGSSATPAAVDTCLTLGRGDKAKGLQDIVFLTVEKQKDDEERAPMRFQARTVPVPGEGGKVHSLVFERLADETKMGEQQNENKSDTERKVFEALEAVATEAGVTATVWEKASKTRKVESTAFYEAKKRLILSVEEGGLGLVSLVHGEHGKRGALFAPSLREHSGEVTEQTDNLIHSVTPSLRSPVGSRAERSDGVRGEESNGATGEEDFDA